MFMYEWGKVQQSKDYFTINQVGDVGKYGLTQDCKKRVRFETLWHGNRRGEKLQCHVVTGWEKHGEGTEKIKRELAAIKRG